MRLFTIGGLLTLLLASTITTGCKAKDIFSVNGDVNVGIRNPLGLRVHVWDDNLRGPYRQAFIEVLPAPTLDFYGDNDYTDETGWTGPLMVPANAGRCQYSLTYYDERGNPHTGYYWAGLINGTKEEYVRINTNVP